MDAIAVIVVALFKGVRPFMLFAPQPLPRSPSHVRLWRTPHPPPLSEVSFNNIYNHDHYFR